MALDAGHESMLITETLRIMRQEMNAKHNKDFSAETERLILRRIIREDLEYLERLFTDPEVMRFSLNGPVHKEKVQEIVEMMLKNEEEYGFDACAIINKESGAWMGFCGLKISTKENRLEGDFAYRLLKEYWGQGFATEAVKACLDHIFKIFGNIVIKVYVQKENIPSIRVAEKAGMSYGGEATYHGIPVLVYQIP